MLRIGIAGCGRAARIHLDRLVALAEVAVVGCADSDRSCAEALASRIDQAASAGRAQAGVFNDHRELLRRLKRLNGLLGWDHSTEVILPIEQLGTPGLRGALWSALYAGGHAVLAPGAVRGWDPGVFTRLVE